MSSKKTAKQVQQVTGTINVKLTEASFTNRKQKTTESSSVPDKPTFFRKLAT